MEPYQELEKHYAAFTGSTHAISCNSGTSALHLALLSLGVGPGDEVIVPDFTMAAVAFAVSYCGATPVFGDVDLATYGLLPSQVHKLITPKTKAVIAVHTYGRLCDIGMIVRICKLNNVAVIEDACEAQGAVYKSIADVACYSFYRNKIVAAEEGGMLTTERADIDERARYLKNMAFSPEHDYFHREIGYNYRMPNAQAKLALVSLHKYRENAKKRREIEGWYENHILNHLPGRQAVWFYETPVSDKASVLTHPKVRDSFKPLSTFPMYGSKGGQENARTLSQNLVLLPADPSVTPQEVASICHLL